MQCPNCRYDLTGLNSATAITCPECGGAIKWEVATGGPVQRTSRTNHIALILAPHVSAVLFVIGIGLGLRYFGRRDLPEPALTLALIVYLVASPFCATASVFGLMGSPDRAVSKVLAAIGGLAVCVPLTLVVIQILMWVSMALD